MTTTHPTLATLFRPTRIVKKTRSAAGQHAKRTLDVTGAVFGLLLFWPLLSLLAILVRFGPQGGPVLFAHTRIGRDGREFPCYKFRTMRVDGDKVIADHLAVNAAARREWKETFKLQDDPRITPVGHTLRKLSLDELPQLLNVLQGDMSLVGPRPVVRTELRRYGRSASYYLRLRPGLTGLWQISGRNDVSYRKRIAYDRYYSTHWSFYRDIIILVRTIPVILFAKGSY